MSDVLALVVSEERMAWALLKTINPHTELEKWRAALADWKQKEALRYSEFLSRADMASKVLNANADAA